jgi:hypothetical protein
MPLQQPERQRVDVRGELRVGPAPSRRPVHERFAAGNLTAVASKFPPIVSPSSGVADSPDE